MIRFIIAMLLPWLLFLTIGRWFAAIICAVLQFTVVGWLPAAIWAVYALSQYNTDKKIKAMKAEMQSPVESASHKIAAVEKLVQLGRKVFGL